MGALEVVDAAVHEGAAVGEEVGRVGDEGGELLRGIVVLFVHVGVAGGWFVDARGRGDPGLGADEEG